MERQMPQLKPIIRLTMSLASLAVAAVVVRAQTLGTPERFTAAAMNTSRGTAGNVEMQVDRWSSDAERDKLINALTTKGADKLLDVLQDLPVKGNFRAPGQLGWDIRFARHYPTEEGGERVVLATDRPIGFLEAANQPRSINYPFTVIEMQLNRDGEGKGTVSLATKVVLDKKKNMITLENFALQPVLLTQVKRTSSFN
jgi:hypothetical protein